jgi:hypothetical protein
MTMRGKASIAAIALLTLFTTACGGPKKAATDGKASATPATSATTSATTGVVTPVPLPDSANFPVPAATIAGWVANSDTASIRGHAWSLWQGMAAPSGQYRDKQPLPIWDTWADTTVVFPQPQVTTAALATPAAAPAPPNSDRKFLRPAQFHHTKDARLKALAMAASDSFPLAVDSKYNPQAATFIGAPQPGPGGGSYAYASGASLTKLNAAWPSGTTPQDRGVNAFPIRAIETKPVFGLVKAGGLTVQPLWQGPSASTKPGNPTPDTWKTCVVIQPGATGAVRPASKAEIAAVAPIVHDQGLGCQTYLWAPLSTFYAAQLNAAEAQSFNAATGGDAAAGDYSVLLAMHVNTKEIPFWTWQTFWWQPGADTPNNFPGNKQGQPASLGAPWNNYASCTAYDQTTTPGGATMQLCFNPYLETSPGIPVGITSNCMSCHGVALVGPNPIYPAAYKKPIAFFTDPTYFDTRSTHTDFSWAVAGAP